MSKHLDAALTVMDELLDDQPRWFLTRAGITAHVDSGYGVALCGIARIAYHRPYKPGDTHCERCVARLHRRESS